MNKISICHLYSDTLNAGGDSGNIKALIKHLGDIKVELKEHKLGELINWEDYDIFYLGSTQDFDQDLIMNDMKKSKIADAIKNAIEHNKTFVAVAGGMQLLGKYFETLEGKTVEYVGALDLYTINSNDREAREYLFETEECGKIVGFENHSGKTYLGPSVRRFGKIIAGAGNNGEDKSEGVRYKNVFGTYAGGPVLVKNPKFCDFILNTALKEKYNADAPLLKSDIKNEQKAHDFIQNRIESNAHISSNF